MAFNPAAYPFCHLALEHYNEALNRVDQFVPEAGVAEEEARLARVIKILDVLDQTVVGTNDEKDQLLTFAILAEGIIGRHALEKDLSVIVDTLLEKKTVEILFGEDMQDDFIEFLTAPKNINRNRVDVAYHHVLDLEQIELIAKKGLAASDIKAILPQKIVKHLDAPLLERMYASGRDDLGRAIDRITNPSANSTATPAPAKVIQGPWGKR